MKQITLNPYEDSFCLTGFMTRWALFGILMWWISSGLGWSHAATWLIGLAIGFAMARKELDV